MSNVIFLNNVVASFPAIETPNKTQLPDGTTKETYQCSFIIEPSNPAFNDFIKLANSMLVDMFKEKASQVFQMIQADRKTRCFGKGEERVNNKTFEVYDGYAGNYFITASNKNQPQIINATGKAAQGIELQNLAKQFYGGCLVNAVVQPWIQKNQHGNGIRCNLIAIQFAGDGKRFGNAAPDVTNMFGQVTTAAAPAANPFADVNSMPWNQ